MTLSQKASGFGNQHKKVYIHGNGNGGNNGYANWGIDQPCNARDVEDCMEMNYKTATSPGWHDRNCTAEIDAICENQPQMKTHLTVKFDLYCPSSSIYFQLLYQVHISYGI